MSGPFVMFGSAHLAALLLGFGAPLGLAAMARSRRRLDRPIRLGLALLLAGGLLGWYGLLWARGWLGPGNALPLNLCDWAALVLILALVKPGQRSYELGYFWGLGGTLQGLLTPDIAHGFPDPRFLFFFIEHAGIVAAVLYLTLGTGLRPAPASIPRVLAATLFYAAVAGTTDLLLGTNYGFLIAKPANASLMDFLAPWPWYLPELAVLGIASAFFYYAPFYLLDRVRGAAASSA